MGTKTTTDVEKKNIVLSKIVKLTYIQTLAMDGGLASVGDIAGETQASSTEDITASENKSKLDKFIGSVKNIVPISVGDLFPGSGKLFQDIATSLFGKKTTVTKKIDVSESGWTVSKVWNQPQFDIIRYAIGIKDLTVAQFSYEQTSEIISIPWRSPKEVTKVYLSVDQFVPTIFPPGNYIEYYVKPNIDDADWIRINPISLPSVFNSDGSIVPRIINFNTEKPLSSRLEDAYITTANPVTEVVFRAILSRPDALDGTTASADGYSPVLKSYRLFMVPKNGL